MTKTKRESSKMTTTKTMTMTKTTTKTKRDEQLGEDGNQKRIKKQLNMLASAAIQKYHLEIHPNNFLKSPANKYLSG